MKLFNRNMSVVLCALLLFLILSLGGPTAMAGTEYRLVSEWSDSTKVNQPRGADIGPNDRLYLADTGNHQVDMFDPNVGSQIAHIGEWGSFGSGNGQFNAPLDVAVATDGRVYVADTGNNRIQVFTKTGAYLFQWPIKAPEAVALSPSGNVYVIVPGDQGRIHVFTSGGSFVRIGDTPLLTPWDLTVGSDGNVVALDFRWSAVEVYNANLSGKLKEWNLPCVEHIICYSGSAIDSDSRGNIYVHLTFLNQVIMNDNQGTELARWDAPGSEEFEADRDAGIAVHDAGNVFTIDPVENKIRKFAPDSDAIVSSWTNTPSVVAGRWARVAGTVQEVTGDGVASVPVHIQKRRLGSADKWTWQGTDTTSQTGFYDHWFKPDESFEYRAYFPRGTGYFSDNVPITVKYAITAWNAYSSLTYGGWTKTHGLLKDLDGQPLPATSAYLQVWDYAKKTWVWVATDRTAPTGYFSFWHKPYGTTHYRVATWGSASVSNQVTKTVYKKVLLNPGATRLNFGSSTRIQVEVQPRHPGSVAYFQEWDTAGQKWVWIKTLTMDSSSKASYIWKPKTRGWHAIRIMTDHHWDHDANGSRVHWIEVRSLL